MAPALDLTLIVALLTLCLLSLPEDLTSHPAAQNGTARGHRAKRSGGRAPSPRAGEIRGPKGPQVEQFPEGHLGFVSAFLLCRQQWGRGD